MNSKAGVIHINRVLRRLCEQRVVDFHDGVMVVEDPARLAALANAYQGSAAFWQDGAAVLQKPPPPALQPSPSRGVGQTGLRRA